MLDFKDKVVIITGASSGIGAEAAELLASLGANLVVSGRNEVNLQKVLEKCQVQEDYPAHLSVIGDVTEEEVRKQIIEKAIERFGKIDVLVNNAGIIETGSIETTSLDQLDRVMNTNVRSIYHLTMLAVPYLIKSQGNIVNLSSVCGMRSFPGVLAYNISKASVEQFTRCVALELAAKNVRVNCVSPGVVVTDLHKRGGMDEGAYADFLEHCRQTHALGRPGEVKEVAAAIAFLASPDASFITGASLPVDGGRHAMCPR